MDKEPRNQRYASPRAAAFASATRFGALPCPVNAGMALLLWIEQFWIKHWIRHAYSNFDSGFPLL
jgi:hypothetical protein